MSKEYPERTECDFSTNYSTPYVWEYSPVTQQDRNNEQIKREALELIRKEIYWLSEQTKRRINAALNLLRY